MIRKLIKDFVEVRCEMKGIKKKDVFQTEDSSDTGTWFEAIEDAKEKPHHKKLVYSFGVLKLHL
ncbi:hypothetical protein MNBD_GAMMA11-3443 [hydrothermal vent metagenome]|uniref:Uncharacterized protein n=1 Tax=hydrothermal vent metagenome TaxID=652676 RepID=A0A3B0XRJ4_9ZZZZ